jgi:hypothetical protein
MQSDHKKLVEKNQKLTHSELLKVLSHVQREEGARVNMTYYLEEEIVAGIAFEVMKVVRIKRG